VQAETPLSGALRELDAWVEHQHGRLSARIVDTESGQVLAEVAPTVALNPASTMKLVTAGAALSLLGPQFRYATELHGSWPHSAAAGNAGATVQTGHAPRLVLRGHGDPSLRSQDLRELAHEVVALGLKEAGQIVVDQSAFDAQFVPPAFEQQPDEWATFRAPVSAIAVERNSIELNVLPERAGEPARAWFEPPGAVLISGSVATRAPGSGQAVGLGLTGQDGLLRAELSGYAAEGLPRLRFARRLEDPRLVPGFVLSQFLKEQGVLVPGGVSLGGEAEIAPLVVHQSEPLSVLVQQLGKNSDNFYAEMLLKTLGAHGGQRPATSSSGAAAIVRWLQEQGAWTEGTRVENGSGLFDANRLSAHTLTTVLSTLSRTPDLFPEFLTQLSIAGSDGTFEQKPEHWRAP
jgi:serine-type D-Ala-D-Ala carboxypeptidase/endopeptidase (penicillin-binding protein 4)